MDKYERMNRAGELYKKKKTMTEIAEELEISVSTVSSYISTLGLKEKRAETLASKIMKLYNQGLNMMQIAYELEISKRYVSSVLRDNGIGKHYSKYEDNLINENTKFAEKKKPVLEKEIINGVRYTVINSLIFSEG